VTGSGSCRCTPTTTPPTAEAISRLRKPQPPHPSPNPGAALLWRPASATKGSVAAPSSSPTVLTLPQPRSGPSVAAGVSDHRERAAPSSRPKGLTLPPTQERPFCGGRRQRPKGALPPPAAAQQAQPFPQPRSGPSVAGGVSDQRERCRPPQKGRDAYSTVTLLARLRG
jgi:hypothetical protein